jgi:hypothetical protein
MEFAAGRRAIATRLWLICTGDRGRWILANCWNLIGFARSGLLCLGR